MAPSIWFLLSVVITATAASSPVFVAQVPRKCPTNEVLKARAACPPDTCDSLYLSFLCIANQTEEVVCTCKDGYLRTNSTGVCVPTDRCLPPECADDPNAQRGCGNRCKKTCADYNDTNKVCNNDVCNLFGCECKDGFIYDDVVKKCVKPEQCTQVPRKCPANEVLKARAACPPDTCDSLYLSFLCIANQTEEVVCTCKDGYLRTNSTGVCVPTDRCLPPECADDPNAQSGCGNRCKKTCADYNDTNKVCNKKGCKLFGCECKEGFVYDDFVKKCVKPEQCTKQCTKPHERYSSCLLAECRPKTCDDLGKPIACPSVAAPCAGGCTCEDGFVRNSNGDCVDQTTCPSCGGDPNAVSGCSNYCGKTCASLAANKSSIACAQYCLYNGCNCKKGYLYNTDTKKCVLEQDCPKPTQQCGENEEYYCGSPCPEPSCFNPDPDTCINEQCQPACFCKKGFVRDANNKCVAINTCPIQCPNPHERYTKCLLGECIPKTCDDLGKPIACASIASPCAGGCACEEGFLRNSNGTCVDQKTCPSCGGDPNAVSGCSNYCGKTCPSILDINKASIACPDYCEYNGCDCKQGYLYNTDTKKCVLERDCPKPPQQCGENEEYYCGTSCPEPSCNTPNPPICINKRCKLACFCKKGFVRDANNKCIAVDRCPSCPGPHEIYSSCPAGQCQPKTCDNLINPAPCPRVIPPCPGGCICEEGYLRNSQGTCIEKNKCPQVSCNSNQTYVNCNVKCPDRYCPDNDQPQPVCDPPRNCPPGCACKINYRLDKNDNCILASECPPINCTRQNEVFDSCPSDCLAENCEDADTPSAVCNTLLLNCQPKCVCKSGHYRNKDGLCIPARECPSVCKDPNAEWKDCQSICPGTCENTRPICLSKTYICHPGCECKKGYVLSKTGGKCVEIERCSEYANCGANETFVQCTFRCPQVVCPKSDRTILCKPPRDCPGGCGCKPNYRYNATGNCILGSDCPPVKCTRPNEEFVACRSPYDYERCKERYNSPPIVAQPGDDVCNPRCTCIKGYYKSDSNQCVPEKDCHSANCGANQTYVECTFRCPQVVCPESDQTILCKPPRDCPGGCGCKPNYRYNASGDCILGSDCPPVECTRPNEEFVTCRSPYDYETCEERYNSPPIIPQPGDDECNPRCTCIKGYYRTNSNECVPEKDCPPIS